MHQALYVHRFLNIEIFSFRKAGLRWSKFSVTCFVLFAHCSSFFAVLVVLRDLSAMEKRSPSSLVSPDRLKII